METMEEVSLTNAMSVDEILERIEKLKEKNKEAEAIYQERSAKPILLDSNAFLLSGKTNKQLEIVIDSVPEPIVTKPVGKQHRLGVQHQGTTTILPESGQRYEKGTQVAVDLGLDSLEDYDESGSELLVITKLSGEKEEKTRIEVEVLPTDESQAQVSTATFSSFMTIANEKVERILNAAVIAGSLWGDSYYDDESNNISLEHVASFNSPDTMNRQVTAMVSRSDDNIFVAYGRKTKNESLEDKKGVIYLWNILKQKTPERDLYGHAPITAISASPYAAHLLVGGDDTGCLTLWDLRNKSMNPIMWSSLDANTHQDPIVGIYHIGSAMAHQVLSIDHGGLICTWSPESFSSPTSSVDVQGTPNSSTNAGLSKMGAFGNNIIATACTMNPNDHNSLTIGTFGGSILGGTIGSQENAMVEYYVYPEVIDATIRDKSVVNPLGSSNLISSVSYMSPVSVSHPLLLSTDLDGKLSVWSLSSDGNPATRRPLFSRNHTEFISTSVAHPSHAGVFAVASKRSLELWDLSQMQGGPVCSIEIFEIITKMIWGKNDSNLWVGYKNGDVQLYALRGLTGDSAVTADDRSRMFGVHFGLNV